MTITYCLTTKGADVHSAATLISALSVRRFHPEARILVLTDADSARNLNACSHALRDVADEIITAHAPDGPPSMRNRFIKTQQRKLVRGDFLYLDGDTVVVAPLDEIFRSDAPFAAAPNQNSPGGAMESNFADELNVFRANGWAIRDLPYLNGGVLFFRDTPETHMFSEVWHRKWREASRSGRHFDQQALNSALWDSGIACRVLPQRFNAQIHTRPCASKGASIWHIYAALPKDLAPRTHLDALLETCLARGTISENEVNELCRKRHPWIISNPLDGLVVWSMVHNRDFLPLDAFERKWLAGRGRRACSDWARSVLALAKSKFTPGGGRSVTFAREPAA